MKRLRQLSIQRLALGAIVMAITAILTIVLRESVRESIVVPMTQFFWLVDLLIRAMPQSLQLALLTGLGAAVLMRSIVVNLPTPPAEKASAGTRPQPTRLGEWLYHVNGMDHSSYSAERVASDLRKILVSGLIANSGDDRDGLITRAERGELDVPPDVRDVLLGTPPWLTRGGWTSLPLPGIVDRLLRRARPAPTRQRHACERLANVAMFAESLVKPSLEAPTPQ
jgi:hypothetical protein